MGKIFRKQMKLQVMQEKSFKYKEGDQKGFDRCMPTALYSVMTVTKYKNNGLNKIYEKILELDHDMKENKSRTGLTYKDIYQILFEELNFVVSEDTKKQAEAFLSNLDEVKKDKKRKKELELSLRRYEEFKSFFMIYTLDFNPGTKPYEKEMLRSIYDSYKKGECDGFFRALSIVLFAVYSSTNYKHDGLFSILDKTLFLDNAIETEGCELSLDLMNYALLEEAGLTPFKEFLPKAEAYKKEVAVSGEKKAYKEMIENELKRYIDTFYLVDEETN